MEAGRHIKRSAYNQIVDNIMAEAGLSREKVQSIEIYPGEVVINYFLSDGAGQFIVMGDSVCTYEVKLPVLDDTP